MSAECGKHGCDLLGNGECRECTLEADVARLSSALRSLYDFLPRYSCKAPAPDGCAVCVARAALDAVAA